MKVEILFPEVCFLFGDKANMRYLQECLPNAEFIKTGLTDVPKFVNNDDISLVYLCSMTENRSRKSFRKIIRI